MVYGLPSIIETIWSFLDREGRTITADANSVEAVLAVGRCPKAPPPHRSFSAEKRALLQRLRNVSIAETRDCQFRRQLKQVRPK